MAELNKQEYILLIKKHLPERLWEKAQQFSIPEKFIKEMSKLVVLVLDSRSMNKAEEKQSWFNLMPLMNDDQIHKLDDILSREKKKLEEIEQKYEQKKVEIKKKYLLKRQNMGYVKKVQNIRSKEAEHRESEMEEAEELLENI